jgi:hypothetical protein
VIAEELVEAVHGRQIFVAVAEMVLTELAGRIADRLERFGDGDVLGLQANRCAHSPLLRRLPSGAPSHANCRG